MGGKSKIEHDGCSNFGLVFASGECGKSQWTAVDETAGAFGLFASLFGPFQMDVFDGYFFLFFLITFSLDNTESISENNNSFFVVLGSQQRDGVIVELGDLLGVHVDWSRTNRNSGEIVFYEHGETKANNR